MIVIWYLLYCHKQNERETLDICRQNISKGALLNAFVFTYDRMRRFQGEWHMEKQLMFPAGVFLESDDEATLMEELRRYSKKAKPGAVFKALAPVKKSEEMFLKSLCGESRHLVMSKGVIQDGITQITEGPLRGMEERICRIDRHKRLARLAVPQSISLKKNVTGNATSESSVLGSVPVGLEIIEKS